MAAGGFGLAPTGFLDGRDAVPDGKKLKIMEEALVYRIVLTGGPCGGKSTAMSQITDRLQGFGFDVYRVPEAATIVLGGGVRISGVSSSQLIAIQSELMRVMIAMEDSFTRLAHATGRRSIVLCDRGTMDVSAYLPPESWSAMLNEVGWSLVALRDRRYEAVIHLVTAADGAEGFYTKANNAVRTESPSLARELDKKVRDAWIGHPHLRVVDNSTDFTGKIQRVVAAVCQVVGVPQPHEIERKFLIRPGASSHPVPVPFEEVEIEQTYLVSPDGREARVRRRGQNGSFSYTHTIKTQSASGDRVEIEKQIAARDYVALLAQADPTRQRVIKRRRVFLWENQYFEWDIYLSPRAGLEILEIEVEDIHAPITLPAFLLIDREVTTDLDFSNAKIALDPSPS